VYDNYILMIGPKSFTIPSLYSAKYKYIAMPIFTKKRVIYFANRMRPSSMATGNDNHEAKIDVHRQLYTVLSTVWIAWRDSSSAIFFLSYDSVPEIHALFKVLFATTT
jgi:hypothetical protein